MVPNNLVKVKPNREPFAVMKWKTRPLPQSPNRQERQRYWRKCLLWETFKQMHQYWHTSLLELQTNPLKSIKQSDYPPLLLLSKSECVFETPNRGEKRKQGADVIYLWIAWTTSKRGKSTVGGCCSGEGSRLCTSDGWARERRSSSLPSRATVVIKKVLVSILRSITKYNSSKHANSGESVRCMFNCQIKWLTCDVLEKRMACCMPRLSLNILEILYFVLSQETTWLDYLTTNKVPVLLTSNKGKANKSGRGIIDRRLLKRFFTSVGYFTSC